MTASSASTCSGLARWPPVRCVRPGWQALERNAEAVGDLGRGETSVMVQSDEFAVLVGQCVEGATDKPSFVDLLVRRCAADRLRLGDEPARRGRLGLPVGALDGDGSTAGDGRQPWL